MGATIGTIETDDGSSVDLNGSSHTDNIVEHGESEVNLGADGKQQIGKVSTYDDSKLNQYLNLQGHNVASNFVLGDMGILQGGNVVSNSVMGSMGNMQGHNVVSNNVMGSMGNMQGHNVASNFVMGDMGNMFGLDDISKGLDAAQKGVGIA